MKKSFIGTFTELEEKLDYMLREGTEIFSVNYVSEITAVNSFSSDNVIRCFVIEYALYPNKEKNVPTTKKI